MFKIENLNMIYDMEKETKTYALKNINLDIFENKFIGIMGPSGSGKSSLLYSMAGLKEITSGSISYNGMNYSSMSKSELAAFRKNEFGFIFQRHFLIEYMTALENILTPVNSNSKEYKEKALHLLERMNISNLANKTPAKLSGGQRQKVALARALINSPKVIFGDEPTAALDHNSAEEVVGILEEFKKDALIIVVTHDASILKNADSIINIWDGEIESINNRERSIV